SVVGDGTGDGWGRAEVSAGRDVAALRRGGGRLWQDEDADVTVAADDVAIGGCGAADVVVGTDHADAYTVGLRLAADSADVVAHDGVTSAAVLDGRDPGAQDDTITEAAEAERADGTL